jgi:UDP-2,3-diacylglucosamine pyrophosphatase LpxH
LDPEFALILNGDTIDDPHKNLSPEDQAIVEFLKRESHRREIFWVYGNHDADYLMPEPENIVFSRHIEVQDRLLVVHGDNFDEVMPRSALFVRFLSLLHELRIKLGAHPVHVAEFAKKRLGPFYKILTKAVKKNAVKCAVDSRFEAVTCGHVHYMEDSVCDGVRYLNTATWTEEPLPYIEMVNDTLVLKTARC